MKTKTSKSRKSNLKVSEKKEPVKKVKKEDAVKKDIATTYNEYKKFGGRQYTGMKVGRTHKWLWPGRMEGEENYSRSVGV